MLINNNKISIFFFLFFFNFSSLSAEIIKKIEILGNERIPKTTIKMLSNIDVNDSINENKINEILKDLYNSNFFEDISINYNNNILSIFVKELPIIESITIEGVKAKKIKEAIKKELSLKSRSSFNELILLEDKKKITHLLKNIGYYFATVDVYSEELKDNKINLQFSINLGNKAKIKELVLSEIKFLKIKD